MLPSLGVHYHKEADLDSGRPVLELLNDEINLLDLCV